MKKQVKRSICFILACGVLSLKLFCVPMVQAGEESVGAVFLDEPAGARPVAMGGAFIAVAQDANAVYWNPAGLVKVQRKELLVSHAQYLQGFKHEYLAFCFPWTTEDSFGVNAFFSYSDPMEKMNDAGELTGTFMNYDMYFGLAYSHAFDQHYSLGGALKGVYQSIDVYNAWSVAADAGVTAAELVPNLQLALMLRNLGKPMVMVEKSHWLNTAVELGSAYSLWNQRLLCTFDVRKPVFQEMMFKLGFEGAVIEDLLWLRAGYRYSQFGNDLGPWSGATFGVGIRVSDYSVDYAYSPFPELGDVHKLAITLPLGRSLREEQQLLEKLEKQVKAKQKTIFNNLVQEGDKYFVGGDYEKADGVYAKAYGMNPEDRELKRKIALTEKNLKKKRSSEYVRRGQKAFGEQDYLTALVEWSKALETASEDETVKQLLAKANRKLSEEKLSATNNKNRQLIEQYFQQGLQLLQKGRYAEALDMWKKILALDPDNLRVAQYLRVTKSKMEDLIQDLFELADRDWDNGQKLNAVKKWRYILDMSGNNTRALEKIEINKTSITDLADTYYRMGVEEYVKSNLPSATEHWRNVLVLTPNNPKALQSLQQAQKKQQALDSLE
jgi:tetratricopeptide (TPR) repeat protein